MSGHLSVGVIGHVDHGKTALVRALTGTETDRLLEERERGLSIVLGFAFLSTSRGDVDLIDVPGHEDFVRAMIGGATGIKAVLLCVAANEGVMPQTVEHLNIAGLLGIDRGCVVLTKADTASQDMQASLEADIARLVHGTFLEHAPRHAVSAVTGDGLDDLRRRLESMVPGAAAEPVVGNAFMPIDRVFSARGFGLIVTGTLRGGTLEAGDEVEIQPAGKRATIRALQNHNRDIPCAQAGHRVAVNLRQLDRDDVRRGDVLCLPGGVVAVERFDVEVELLASAPTPIRNGSWLRCLTGTTEANARIRLLDRRELMPGDRTFAQLSLDRPVATRAAERFLLRNPSPPLTVGGGRIVEVGSRRHRRFDAAVTRRLEAIASGNVERIVRQRLLEAGAAGVALGEMADQLDVGSIELVESATRAGAITLTGDVVVDRAAFAALADDIVRIVQRSHAEHPLRVGIDAGGIAIALRSHGAPVDSLQHALRSLVDGGRLGLSHELYFRPDHDPFARLGERERRLADHIERAFLAAGLAPPAPVEVVGADRVKRAVLRLLLETGTLVRLRTYDRGRQIVLHSRTVEQARSSLTERFPFPAAFAIKDVRDLLHSTRRHVVPLMEHFDAVGLTSRSGDLRRLREH